MRKLIYLFLSILIFSCESPSTENEQKTVFSSPKIQKNTTTDTLEDIALWADSLIMLYIKKHDFKMSQTDSFPLTFIKEEADWNGEKYIATRIGQSFEDHFATNRWLYIKEGDKKIFEYDVVNDSLILWKNE